MKDIVAWVLGLPAYVVIPLLWSGALIRSNATYWVGRGAVQGAGALWRRARPGVAAVPALRVGVGRAGRVARLRPLATRLIRVFGPAAVVCGFCTIGLQSAIMASAGAVKMPLRRFIPASIVGGLIWAILYATVGLAVFEAWFLAVAGSWWGALALLAAAVAVIGAMVAADRLVLRWQARTAPEPAGVEAPPAGPTS